MEAVHDKKEIKCKECDKSFSVVRLLNAHVRNCHMKTIIPCRICNQLFRTKDKLSKHMQVTHSKAFECNECGAKYTSKSGLRDHCNKKHNENPKLFYIFTYGHGHLNAK